jgi:glycosyltransferase involved in cell wall biosynthesis
VLASFHLGIFETGLCHWILILLPSISLIFTLYILIGIRHLKALKDIEGCNLKPPGDLWPTVSIVVPLCNEAETFPQALSTWREIDFPNLQWILVNDRSTDETLSLLETANHEDPSLQILSIERLPPNWLGKNHALWVGAQEATGDYLLFCDADIHLHPNTLKQALSHMKTQGLDHLTLIPQLNHSGFWMEALSGTFFLFFMLKHWPWEASNPNRAHYMGVGAFNLLKRSVYQSIGTHQSISIRPDDDMQLGKLIKNHGFKQEALIGLNRVSVAWYPSPQGFIQGLMKNTFALMDYNLITVLGGCLAILFFTFAPLLLLVIETVLNSQSMTNHYSLSPIPSSHIPSMFLLLLTLLLYRSCAKLLPVSLKSFIGFPVASLIFVYVMIASTFQCLQKQGIEWRGTFYPLSLLKSNPSNPSLKDSL